MSFRRPTASSLRRAQSTQEAQQRQALPSSLPLSTAVAVTPVTDHAHAASRVDSGLHSRIQRSSLQRCRTGQGGASSDQTPRPSPYSRSPSLREFSSKCDSVMQRAQALLDRTQEQEAVVMKALEERLSQSPARRSETPSPPLSQGEAVAAVTNTSANTASQQTPTRWFRGFSPTPVTASPGFPAAPHTTPVALPDATREKAEDEAHRPHSVSPARSGMGEWLDISSMSPSQPPLPAPPPTPAEARRTSAEAGSPTLLQRIRQSLHRSPTPPPSSSSQQQQQRLTCDDANISPSHFSSDAIVHPSQTTAGTATPLTHASPRKSVKFVSPDKLEIITPTKVVVFSHSDSSDSDEEGRDGEEEGSDSAHEAARASATKRTSVKRAREKDDEEATTTPGRTQQRASAVLPPAPPPSAVKSPASTQKRGRSGSSRSSVTLSPPSPSSSQRTRSPRSPSSSPSSQRASGGRASLSAHADFETESESESATPSRANAMRPDEVRAYVTHHTAKQSLAYLRKREMMAFLREAGSQVAKERRVLKRRLLREIRAVIRRQQASEEE